MANAEYITEAAWHPQDMKEWAKAYWENAVTIDKYLSIPAGRRVMITFPEVVTPYDVEPKFIKAVPD